MDPCSTTLGVGTGPDLQYGPAGEIPSGSGRPFSPTTSSGVEGNITEKDQKAAVHPCNTPQRVGTGLDSQYGHTGETPSGSGKPSISAPSSGIEEEATKETSSTTTRKSDGICLVCALGTKGSHTYEKECKRYVKGATIAQMQRAARGGMKGRHRLLLELALQRSDAERGGTEVNAEAAVAQQDSSTSSSSSTSTSIQRKSKRSASSSRGTGRQTSRQREERKSELKDGSKKQTSAGKKRKIEANMEKKERSPDMVEEILAWQGPGERGEDRKSEAREDKQKEKPASSGNTKTETKQEILRRQEKPRVPPPESARVDETKIDELAVARLEAAREMRQTTAVGVPTRSDHRQEQPNTEKEERIRIHQERPASPVRPGEETPIEGESDTEAMVTEDEQPTESGKTPHPDWKWHSDTKPAEPARAPRHFDLEQIAYWVLWLGKGEECRQLWEKDWNKDQASRDEEELAKRIYNLDKGVREGTTYEELQKLLSTLQGQEEEEWQTANGDGAVTHTTDGGYKTRWESYSWNN